MSEPSRTDNEPPGLRQCGRCRQSFAPDPTLDEVALREWWLCPSCHDTLLGPARAPAVEQEQLPRTRP
jgi:ribosomal protein L37AE/L43A